MKCFLLAGTILLLSIPVLAQIPTDPAIATEYFDKYWYRVSAREKAAYIRAYMGYDSTAGFHKICDYNADGKLMSAWHYSAENPYVREGPVSWYRDNSHASSSGQYAKGKRIGQWTDFYSNGQRKRQYTYPAPDSTADNDNYITDNSWDSTGRAEVRDGNGFYRVRNDSSGIVIESGMIRNGLRHGIWEGFDKDGQKAYEDEYTNGKFIRGNRFEENGACLAYDSLYIAPVFPGGMDAMMRSVYRTIKYPREEIDMGTEGTVIVGFTIDKKGNVSDVTVQRSVSALIDKEAVRVVSRMPAWTPGLQRGKPVAVAYRLPIRFALTEKKSKK